MKQRYWYDLTEKERQSLEQEWRRSEWYARVKRDVRPIQNGSATAYSIISIIGAIWTIFPLISACSIINDGDNVPGITILFIFIGFLIIFFSLGAISDIRTKSINTQIEKEAEKWLLEKYNIKM